jgi:hypothetical protein
LASLGMMAVAWTAFAQQPAVDSQTLLSAKGHAYVTARDAIVAESEAEFERVVAEVAAASQAGKVLAVALRTRRGDLEGAAQFDRRVKEAIDHPQVGADGTPVYYKVSLAMSGRATEALAFEFMLKREDVVAEARWNFLEVLTNPSRASRDTLEGSLALMESAQAPLGKIVACAAESARKLGDDRLTEAIVRAYKACRAQRSNSMTEASRIVIILSTLNTPGCLDAARQIQEVERGIAMAQGLAPWSDVNVDTDMAAIRNETIQMQRLTSQGKEWTAQEQADLNRRRNEVQRRKDTRDLWKRLSATVDELAARRGG